MSKILITGMTAPQASPLANQRSLSFTGVLNKVLVDAGHDVYWMAPDIAWDKDYAEQYDAVIIGVSPITSLSANYAYPALKLITDMYDSPKLTLLFSTPNPSQLVSSLRSTFAKPETFAKTFYSYRPGYNYAARKDNAKVLLGTIDKLLNGQWPNAVYSSLPWTNGQDVLRQFPTQAAERLNPLNLDAYTLNSVQDKSFSTAKQWVADSIASPWTQSIRNTLAMRVSPMKWNKGWNDDQVAEAMKNAIGALVSPHRNGTWWTYRYAQALNEGIPVVTEWKESSVIGEAWSTLAATVESMSVDERRQLSRLQYDQYMKCLLSQDDTRVLVNKLLNI